MTAAETIKNIVIIAGIIIAPLVIATIICVVVYAVGLIIALLRYVILNKIDTTREYNEWKEKEDTEQIRYIQEYNRKKREGKK